MQQVQGRQRQRGCGRNSFRDAECKTFNQSLKKVNRTFQVNSHFGYLDSMTACLTFFESKFFNDGLLQLNLKKSHFETNVLISKMKVNLFTKTTARDWHAILPLDSN